MARNRWGEYNPPCGTEWVVVDKDGEWLEGFDSEEDAKKYMAEHPDEADHIECVEHGA